MEKIPLIAKISLFAVESWIKWLNFWLTIFQKVFFKKFKLAPQNILIYKIGNIGDIVCAVPSFIALRRAYPEAKITLLTSPGKIEASGARELLEKAWYIDELKVYYSADIDSWPKKKKFISHLRENRYDLFIQLPDDLANFRTLFRNMIFAKLIGAKSAFGFKIRTIQLLKNTQVDYSSQKTEVESLLVLLRENGIIAQKIEFNFNVSAEQKNKIERLLKDKWGKLDKKDLIVAMSSGGKREANQWPIERFTKIAKHLQDKYNAKIIVLGGKDDIPKAEIIKTNLREENILIAAGKLEILETLELLKYSSFLISNSTGTLHMAAAVRIPVVGLYGVRDVFGRWLPYGNQHKILYHNFLDCDYRQENCIKKSIEMITVEEVIGACDQLINEIKI